jgi:hypothetical protein
MPADEHRRNAVVRPQLRLSSLRVSSHFVR